MSLHWSERQTDIATQLAAQPKLFVGCDFDGTLSPIVDHPEDALLPEAARSALAALACLPRVTVAIVSGRALADLRSRVDLPELVYVGNHGLEVAGGKIGEWRPMISTASRLELQSALVRLREHLGDMPGLVIEDKRLTGSIHYRMVSHPRHLEVTRAVETVLRDCRTLTIRPGHMVWELRPRFAWNKGVAVRTLLGHFGLPESAAMYVGDDNTDEDVFKAVPGGLTFHVGTREDTSARSRLNSPNEVIELLRWVHFQRSRTLVCE